MGELAGTDYRTELSKAVKSVRAEWRARLSQAARLSPNSKLAKKAGVLLLDLDSLDDRIEEAGGEDELAFVICAQVASGCTLTDWCVHYAIERGLVWAFLTETDERLQRYLRALQGVADEDVSETKAIADGATPEDVGVAKLQIDTRFRRAGKYHRDRFGDQLTVVQDKRVVLELRFGVRREPDGPVVVPADIEDAQVVGGIAPVESAPAGLAHLIPSPAPLKGEPAKPPQPAIYI